MSWWNTMWESITGFLDQIGLLEFSQRLFAAVVIIVAALIVRWLMAVLIRKVVNRIVSGVKRKHEVSDTQALIVSPVAAMRIVQRTRTLGRVINNIANVVLGTVVVLLLVNTLAPGILGSFALLTAALGAGLGFGAQNIVKDVLNGLFMVIEDQYGVGDIVDLGAATGVIEDVSIRITQVRDVNGTLWFVRNGEVLRVGNMSDGWSRVIIDLAIPYDSDIEEIERAILETATEMAQYPAWKSRILEPPEIWGLESISGDALVTRLVAKTRTWAKDDVARELRMRIKHRLDEMGLKLPALHTISLEGYEGAARAGASQRTRTRAARAAGPITTPKSASGEPASPAQADTNKTPMTKPPASGKGRK